MKKVYIYPFSDEILNILDNQNMIKEFEIIGVVNDNKSVKRILNDKYGCKSISIDDLNDEQNLNCVDGIIIYNPFIDSEKIFFDKIVECFIDNQKNIYHTVELSDYVNNLNYEKVELLGDFKYYKNSNCFIENVINIDKPVILVLGLGQNCDKTRVGLNLYNFFVDEGYNPAMVTSNTLNTLFGFYTFPILDLKFESAVKSYNTMLKNISVSENPDLFILIAPAGIVKHDNVYNNLFAYPSFLITSAVIPDITILSVYAGKYELEDINFLKELCYYKLNSKVEYFHISRTVCDMNMETNQLEYMQIDDSNAMKRLINKEFPMYSILDLDSMNEIHTLILSELRGNVEQI